MIVRTRNKVIVKGMISPRRSPWAPLGRRTGSEEIAPEERKIVLLFLFHFKSTSIASRS
jgi:hypothetical protein